MSNKNEKCVMGSWLADDKVSLKHDITVSALLQNNSQ